MLSVSGVYALCDSSVCAGCWPISNSQAGEISVFACPQLICLPSHWSEVGVQSSHLDCIWNVMAHAQKPDFVFRRNGRVHLNRRGHQFSRLLAAEVRASAVVMLDTTCSEVVWRVLATHSICQFPLHFPSCASPCAITFQLDCTMAPSKCAKSPLSELHTLICRSPSSIHQYLYKSVRYYFTYASTLTSRNTNTSEDIGYCMYHLL